MKIGVISDTHGCLETWKKVYDKYFSDADLIIHAGDVLYHGPRNAIPAEYNPKELAEVLNNCPIPIVVACGNCDAYVDGMVLKMPIQSPYAYLMLNDLRIVVNHGHTLDDKAVQETAKQYKASVFITGHTHVAVLEKKDGIVYLNPGSPGMSKRPDGRGTVAIINNKTIEILDINSGEKIITETVD